MYFIERHDESYSPLYPSITDCLNNFIFSYQIKRGNHCFIILFFIANVGQADLFGKEKTAEYASIMHDSRG
jgi:hypothetical protein